MRVPNHVLRPATAAFNSPVIANAASLFGSTVITSLLGFAFWVVAARLFSATGVGNASAAISAMQLVATFGLVGLGTLIIGEAASDRSNLVLISTAAVVATTATALIAFATAVVASHVGIRLGGLEYGVFRPLLFSAGAGLTALTLILDQACVGLSLGRVQLWRNAWFSMAKLVLLPLVLLVALKQQSFAIYAVWSLGTILSLLSLVSRLRRVPRAAFRPAFGSLRGLGKAAFAHHWLNLAAQAPRLLLPVLVATLLSPALNAAFYTATLLVSFGTIIPAHLGVSLFALKRGDGASLAHEMRRSLLISVGVWLAGSLLSLVLGRYVLSLFGSSYTVASPCMFVLALTILPFAVKVHYAAVCRVNGRLLWCAGVSTLGGALEIAACFVGANDGLTGVALGLLLAQVIEAAFLVPSVLRAIRGPLPRVGRPLRVQQ